MYDPQIVEKNECCGTYYLSKKFIAYILCRNATKIVVDVYKSQKVRWWWSMGISSSEIGGDQKSSASPCPGPG